MRGEISRRERKVKITTYRGKKKRAYRGSAERQQKGEQRGKEKKRQPQSECMCRRVGSKAINEHSFRGKNNEQEKWETSSACDLGRSATLLFLFSTTQLFE